MQQTLESQILDTLKQIVDAELGNDIVTLGFVRELELNGSETSFKIFLTEPNSAKKDEIKQQAEQLVGALEGIDNVSVTMDFEVPQGRGIANNQALPGVKNIVAVSSGKGGVGKSTTAVNLAIALAQTGAKVGIMDADVYGPNIPIMLGTGYDQPEIVNGQLKPIEAYGVKMISMAVLVPPDKPMVLRGPMLHGVVRQFLTDVNWGELDYLIVDMPPGTGDVQLSLAQLVPVQGAIIVTTPQEVSLSDVRRSVKMFEQVAVPVIGVIENMSYFIAPDTGNRYDIFGTGGGERLAKEYGLDLLGQVPLGMQVREGGDNGRPIVATDPDSTQAEAFHAIAQNAARQLTIEAMKPELVILTRAK